jgi:hypothetical protein
MKRIVYKSVKGRCVRKLDDSKYCGFSKVKMKGIGLERVACYRE